MEVRHHYISGEENDPEDLAPIGPEEWDETHDVTAGSVGEADLDPALLARMVPGPPGEPGMTWRGPWGGSTGYLPGDVIASGGSAYICAVASTGEEPPHASWDSLAERGATWFDGHGTPNFVPGSKLGDYYLDLDTDIVYQLE